MASTEKRINLVEDAAQEVPLTAGQSVNQTVEDVDMLALLLSKLSPGAPASKALDFSQTYRQEGIDEVFNMTKQMNAKRLPLAEQAKLPPRANWTDEGKISENSG